jgi:hypothetical protein
LTTPEDQIKNKWGVSLVSQASMGTSDLNYANNKDKNYDILNYVGASYKFNKDNSASLRQYVQFNHKASREEVNQTTTPATVATFSHTFKGIMNTDPIAATFWYYAPVTALDRDMQSNGKLRLDAEAVWTLTPKWSVSYYFNPRQSLVPTETTVLVEGKAAPAYAKTTLIHYASLYYNISDAAQLYTNVGMLHNWKTRDDFKLASESYLTNFGAYFAFSGGKFFLNPEIDYEAELPGDSSNVQVATNYTEDKISYVLTAGMSF